MTQSHPERLSLVAQLLLRGKVAYLFERYTDSQEMNVLVVCTASHKQSDVTDVGPVLTEWIRKTQGATATERGRRAPGLLWAVTMFDIKIADSLGKDEDMLHTVWNNLIKMTMLERFGGFEWMQDWANGQSFDNAFLVRKPRMPVAFLDLENGQEVAVTASQASQVGLMERTFLKAELIQSHVANPTQSLIASVSRWKRCYTTSSRIGCRVGLHRMVWVRFRQRRKSLSLLCLP